MEIVHNREVLMRNGHRFGRLLSAGLLAVLALAAGCAPGQKRAAAGGDETSGVASPTQAPRLGQNTASATFESYAHSGGKAQSR